MTDDNGDDFSLEFDSELPPLLPSGNYTVAFLRAEKKWLWGKRLKIFMHFEIVGPTHGGVRLFMGCNVPIKTKWSVGFKYFQAWTLAAGHRPKRKDRLSTCVFRNKYFLAQVKVVTKTAKGTVRSNGAQYSVIDELLSIEAG